MIEVRQEVEYQHREDIQRTNGGNSPALGSDNINNQYKNKYKSNTPHIPNYEFDKEMHICFEHNDKDIQDHHSDSKNFINFHKNNNHHTHNNNNNYFHLLIMLYNI